MKPRLLRYFMIAVAGVFLCGFGSSTPVKAWYTCGGSPCATSGTYTCNAGLTCNASKVCGTNVNTCSGATCNYDAVWSQGAPYNCADQCTSVSGATSTRTTYFTTCSTAATCGDGTETCKCNTENTCSVTCTGGLACDTGTRACCTSQIPQTKPVATAIQSGITRNAQINWTFTDTGSGCGLSWGLKCPTSPIGNVNSFLLKFSGGKSNETASSAVRTLTTGLFPDWGTYSVQVCAENGFGENCSAAVNFTLSPPVCSITGTNSSSVCRNTDPPLTATYGNNADQVQFYTDISNPPVAPYSDTSPWQVSTNYTPSLATGQYYWSAISRSTASPIACTTPAAPPAGAQLNIDKTAPPVPPGSFTAITPDAACLSNYFVTYSWNSVADTGCAGLNASPYQSQISTSNTYAVIADDTNWVNALTMNTALSYPPGTDLYARSRSRDSLNNVSLWSADATLTVPSPTPYPTIWIHGVYEEDLGNTTPSCVGGMTINPTNLNITLNVSGTGASYTCDKQPSYFDCYVTIDNQAVACTVPSHTVSLSGSTYDGYESVEWRTNNQCDGAPIGTITVDTTANIPNPTPIQTFFKYGSQSWFKTSGISFNSKTNHTNTIPNNTTAYDGDDSIDPPNNKYLIINGGGAVLQAAGTSISLGANATAGYSENNWYSDSYTASSNFTPTKFTDYMKSRKAYKTISSTTGLTSGVYYYPGNGTLTLSTATDFDTGRRIVIVADQGTVNITGNITSLGGGTLAIIANSIIIDPAVTAVDAILIGNTVDIGTATNNLKINGNLIQLTNTTPFENKRTSPDARKPSLFVKLDQAGYMNLLDYLSVSMYDWKQLQ